MLNQIVNRLQGQVRIRVETTFPERVLNLCGARNLAFWDMEWESDTAFTYAGMSILAACERRQAVVQMDGPQSVQSDDLLELLQHSVKIVDDVIAG